MKKAFFLLFILTSFTAPAQLPIVGQDGYKGYYTSDPGVPPFTIQNDKYAFSVYPIVPEMFKDPGNMQAVLDTIFDGNKASYKDPFFSSSYMYKHNYIYKVFIYKKKLVLVVAAHAYSAGFEKCKRMLDKQADIYNRDSNF